MNNTDLEIFVLLKMIGAHAIHNKAFIRLIQKDIVGLK